MSNLKKEDGIEELVRPLLKRLELVKERVPENSELEKFIDQIIPEVMKTKDILHDGENLKRELAGFFDKIERQIDPWTDHEPRKKVVSDLPHKETIAEVGESSQTSYIKDTKLTEVQNLMVRLERSYRLVSKCLKSLSIFPENTIFKKKLVIYWWTVFFRGDIEGCEMVLSYLVEEKFLIPVHNREHNQVIDCLTISPIFHAWLISNDERYEHVSFENMEKVTWHFYKEKNEHCRKMLLNPDQKYLDSKNIIDITSKENHLEVVQLGSWHCTETCVQKGAEETGSRETESNDHIEVNQTDFIKKIPSNVRYLSLRGISGITELHESIGKLDLLTVLDLRACHNLEKLPNKPKPRSILKPKLIRWSLPQEKWFENLEVLDISECYLLDHMPKWVCELSSLKVLKGFVVANQSCQLGDLYKLKKLRKLSIRIAVNISGPEVFSGFDSLDSLLVLTITWGQNKYKMMPTYSLPKNLEKLDIRCYPEADASKWQNQQSLLKLKRLYIRGGNLAKIPYHDFWEVEILRLRFLKNLVPSEWNEVRSSFQNLKYVEFVGCQRPMNFPNNENSWRK